MKRVDLIIAVSFYSFLMSSMPGLTNLSKLDYFIWLKYSSSETNVNLPLDNLKPYSLMMAQMF